MHIFLAGHFQVCLFDFDKVWLVASIAVVLFVIMEILFPVFENISIDSDIPIMSSRFVILELKSSAKSSCVCLMFGRRIVW